MISTFFLTKRTDTHADGLAVAGFGKLLSHIGTTKERKVRIQDRGGFFELSVTPPLSREDIDGWDGDPFYIYVKLKGDSKAPPDALDYEAQSVILADARKAKPKGKGNKRKGGASKVVDAETAAYQEATAEPHPEIAFLRTFNGKRSGFKGDIDMNRALQSSPPRDALWAKLTQLANSGVGFKASASELSLPGLKASQWFLPLSGKGISRVKADSAAADQFPKAMLDWFEVWLRYIGMYESMTSHSIGDDLKLAVIAPVDMDSRLLPSIRATIRKANVFGRRIDVRAPIELARALVHQSEEYLGTDQSSTHRLRFNKRRPRAITRGLYVTTYKKMGTASAVMNLAFLGVPNWAELGSRADADAFLATLDELHRYQSVLRDDISEDIETLRVMRDFLSAGTNDAALAFFARVAFDVMKRLAAKHAKQGAVLLSTDTARSILMGVSTDKPMVKTIIEDKGFQRVAKAVRAATIHAQLHSDSVLQPRYGLAQAWRQKAAYKERFVEELARFAQQFNADVARQREIDKKSGRKRLYPALLMQEDLAAVLKLIDDTGSSNLVAHLLLAFGFAQVSKDAPEGDPSGSQEKNQ